MNNDFEIKFIKGIGPKRAQALNSIGITNLKELIEYYPRRYLDRRTVVTMDRLSVDNEVTVVGKIEAAGIKRLRKRIFYLVISDGKGLLEAVWFNFADQYKKVFKVGEWIALSGKISYYRGYQLIHPDYDKLENGDLNKMLNTGKILPLYKISDPLKKHGFNSYVFRKIFQEIINNHLENFEEILPKEIRQKYSFLNRGESYRNIHFPQGTDSLSKCINRFKYEEFFYLQLTLALQSHHFKENEIGIDFSKPSKRVELFFNNLPFQLTNAQKRVIKEIRKDMKKPYPMNRLLQGDVGSGKTLVAVLAMLIALDNGYQSALMVPTEILAEQHYFNISNLLKDLNIQISLLTGSSPKQSREILQNELNKKEPHIIIGTHALFQAGIDYVQLGLIIIDEQHRFGVMQRAALLKKGIKSDLLLMTATPIPRSLALTVYGNLDVSVLDELPPGRKLIKTIWRFDNKSKEIYKFVSEQIDTGAQAFIVFPLVEESENIDLKAATESFINLSSSCFKNNSVELLHGRMKADEKDSIMKRFSKAEIDILVSTTVIEVGVDVQNATIMLIEHAERFGLSQLHQLRGRVGRGNKKSYCILKTPHNISETAIQRMKIMSETNDGFRIAEEDLKIRGWGDFFGTKQHGMPEFKLANPIRDQKLLQQARTDAFDLVSKDPLFKLPENKMLQETITNKYSEKIKLVNIS
jgi:ATP-dependent DNA helicase RecG